MQKKINIGFTAYIPFTSTRDKPKATDFKNMLSALFIMTESKDVISHYKNEAQYMTRIDEIENWEDHFKNRMTSASTSETENPITGGRYLVSDDIRDGNHIADGRELRSLIIPYAQKCCRKATSHRLDIPNTVCSWGRQMRHTSFISPNYKLS